MRIFHYFHSLHRIALCSGLLCFTLSSAIPLKAQTIFEQAYTANELKKIGSKIKKLKKCKTDTKLFLKMRSIAKEVETFTGHKVKFKEVMKETRRQLKINNVEVSDKEFKTIQKKMKIIWDGGEGAANHAGHQSFKTANLEWGITEVALGVIIIIVGTRIANQNVQSFGVAVMYSGINNCASAVNNAADRNNPDNPANQGVSF